jgi:hypothetical protein
VTVEGGLGALSPCCRPRPALAAEEPTTSPPQGLVAAPERVLFVETGYLVVLAETPA